jgi:nucleoside-diphosphate-sugar epimerase
MKKILVTGSSGFLGRLLIDRLLSSGYNVVAISRQSIPGHLKNNPNICWEQLDLVKDEIPIKQSTEYYAVFHLAAILDNINEDSFVIDNELATVRLLKSIAGKTSKFIFASTQMVYGDISHLAVSESFPLITQDNSYACSKVNCENWLRRFQKMYGGQYVILRFCGFIDGGGFIDHIINCAITGKKIELYSEGKVYRDYISSSNGIDAFIAALNYCGKSNFYTFNIGSGQSISTYELSLVVCNEVKSESKIEFISGQAPKKDFVFCIDKAVKLLNYNPGSLIDIVKKYAYEKYNNTNQSKIK